MLPPLLPMVTGVCWGCISGISGLALLVFGELLAVLAPLGSFGRLPRGQLTAIQKVRIIYEWPFWTMKPTAN